MKLLLITLLVLLVSVNSQCAQPKQQMNIRRVHTTASYYETIKIWEGEDVSGTFVDAINGIDMAGLTRDYAICVNKASHTFVLSEYMSNGWTAGSTMDVSVNDVLIASNTVDRGDTKIMKIYPYLDLSTSAEWSYSDTSSDDWYLPTGTVSWSSAAPGSFPVVAEGTTSRYYRASVSVPADVSHFASFEVGIKTAYGYVLYINGEEVLRRSIEEVSEEEEAVYHRVALPIDMLPAESLVIAAEIHFPAEHEGMNDGFVGFMTFVEKGTMRAFGGTVQSDHHLDFENVGIDKAWNMDARSAWHTSSLPAYAQYTFDGQRRDFINAYAITTSGGPAARRPYKWTLSGTNNETEWTVIDKREGVVFTAMYQTKKFTLPHNHASYNMYRINFEEVADGQEMEIGKLELFADDVTYVETPALQYPSETVEFFVGQTNVYFAPVNSGFTTFTTTATLPDGLTLSADSGAIIGAPTTATTSAVSVTVSAVHVNTGETSYTATFSISVVQCTGTRHRVRITKHDGGFGSADLWVLKQGSTVIDSHYGRDIMSSQVTGDENFEYCLTEGVYTLSLSQLYNNAWDYTSYIDVYVYVSETDTMRVLHQTCPLKPATADFEFNTYVLSDNDLTQWTYHADGTIPDGWASSSFTGTWSSVPEERPSLSQNVWLLRRQVTVSSITNLMGFEVMVYHRAGLIFYLNGAEVFRTNVDGTLTATSTGTNLSGGNAVWTRFTERVGTGHLIAGQNVFGVAIVNVGNSALTMDTLIQIRMLSSNGLSVGLETTVVDSHHNTANEVSANMFHGDYSTRWISGYSQPHIVTATFNNGGKHFVNMYCFTAGWNALENSPSGWEVAVSTDGTEFDDVHEVTDVFFTEINQRRCFVMPNEDAIRAIRFTFTHIKQVSDNLQLNAIDLFYVDPAQFTVPTLAYGDGGEVEAFYDADFSLEPSSNLFYDWSVTPDLPAGLVLEGSGVIRGKPTAVAASNTYMVSARNPAGVSVSASVMLVVSACSNGHYHTSMSMTNTQGVGARMIILVTTVEGNIYYNENVPDWSHLFNISFCVPSGMIKYTLFDRNNEGWPNEYTIVAGDDVTSGGVGRGQTPLILAFAPFYYVEASVSTIQFSQVTQQDGWYERDATRNWDEVTLNDMPTVSGLTSYYCATFDASSLDEIATIEFAANIRGGYVMYLNGHEVNRYRVPEGATHETPSEDEDSAPHYISYIDSAQLSYVEATNNVVCYEVHTMVSRPDEDNTFNMYVKPHMGGRELTLDGEGTCSHPGFYSSAYDERCYHAFNKNNYDKFYAEESTCSNVWTLYTFGNNKRDYATRGLFYRGNNVNRRPRSVTVQATNNPEAENPTFDTLATDTIDFAASASKEVTFVPSKPYRAYRAVFNGCESQGIEVGEIYFYSDRLEGAICRPQNGLPGTTEGSTVYGECPLYYEGQVNYLCSGGEYMEMGRACTAAAPISFEYEATEATAYTKKSFELKATFQGAEVSFVTLPNLPAGLEVDQTTGNIVGTPTEAREARRYTINCRNDAGSIQAVVNLTVIETPTPVWVYIVIAVAVVVVIAIIVVIIIVIVKKSKSGKGKGKGGKKKSKTLPKQAAPAPKMKETPGSKKIAV